MASAAAAISRSQVVRLSPASTTMLAATSTKMPAVPRSGCFRMSRTGGSVLAAGKSRSRGPSPSTGSWRWKWRASMTMSASFPISEGWIDTGPREIQRLDPETTVPMNGSERSISSPTAYPIGAHASILR